MFLCASPALQSSWFAMCAKQMNVTLLRGSLVVRSEFLSVCYVLEIFPLPSVQECSLGNDLSCISLSQMLFRHFPHFGPQTTCEELSSARPFHFPRKKIVYFYLCFCKESFPVEKLLPSSSCLPRLGGPAGACLQQPLCSTACCSCL